MSEVEEPPKRKESLCDEPKRTFEQWLGDCISKRGPEANNQIKGRVFYYGCLTEISALVLRIRAISENSNVFESEDSEFEEKQREWWFCFAQLQLMRGFLINYYRLQPPQWEEEIVPDNEYMGVLLSKEDFRKFVRKPPTHSGLVAQDAVNVDEYEVKKNYPETEEGEDYEKEILD